jgi:hypothetical protein
LAGARRCFFTFQESGGYLHADEAAAVARAKKRRDKKITSEREFEIRMFNIPAHTRRRLSFEGRCEKRLRRVKKICFFLAEKSIKLNEE